jgi:hypothetical protein
MKIPVNLYLEELSKIDKKKTENALAQWENWKN